jgi:5'-nucleotidase
MQENIIIPNPENLEKTQDKIISEGAENFHVLADFDRTLTKAFVNGEKTPSIISVLRNENYLSEEYSLKAKELANYYHPIEIDSALSIKVKKKKMQEWWEKHFDLLIKSGLNKNNIKRVIEEGKIEFREGISEMLDSLHEKNIPLIIISSSGIGDLIPMYFEKQEKLYKNIHIITNMYKWDSKGNAIDVKKPIIHVFNKDETVLEEIPEIYKEIKDRKNVLLLGDSLGDLGMIEGFEYKNIIKIGFLNEEIEKNMKSYKNNFDMIITNDSDANYINEFIKKID